MLTSIIAGAIIGMIAGALTSSDDRRGCLGNNYPWACWFVDWAVALWWLGATICWHGSGTVSLWSSIVGGHFFKFQTELINKAEL